MPKTTAASKPSGGHTADLESLTQQQAAWLIGKPTSWLRDRADLDGRRPDGKYHARDLVRAFLADTQAKLAPAALSEWDVHRFAHAIGFYDVYCAPLAIEMFEQIQASKGTAGLAAIGQLFAEMLRDQLEMDPDRWNSPGDVPPPKSAAEIRAELEAKLEEDLRSRVKDELERERRSKGQVIDICPTCKRVLWARKWQRKDIPAGFVVDEQLDCDDCYSRKALARLDA